MFDAIGVILYNDKDDKVNYALTAIYNENMFSKTQKRYGQVFLDMLKDVDKIDRFSEVVDKFNNKFNLDTDSEHFNGGKAVRYFDVEMDETIKKFASDLGVGTVFIKNLTNQEIKYDDEHIAKPNQITVTSFSYDSPRKAFLCNNLPDQCGLTGLETLDDKSIIPRNVEWEGNVYIELYPFTQNAYDTVLITDPTNPNYVGSFNEVEKKYFDYLQAKGSGEDVKSPITINNLVNREDKVHATVSLYALCSEVNNDVRIEAFQDIKIKAGNLETDYDKATPCIVDRISTSLLDGKNSGSFTYNELVVLNKADLKDIQWHFDPYIRDDYFIHMEPVPKTGSLSVEIQDKVSRQCLVSFDHKYNPLEVNLYDHYDYYTLCEIVNDTKEQLNRYMMNKDFNEFQKEKELTDYGDSLCLKEELTVLNCNDYGDAIGGSFVFRNEEYEFDYNINTFNIDLYKFNYDIEDNETGYYKEEGLPALLENPDIQDMIFEQIDLEVNSFIAKNRYGSLDDILAAAEEKAASQNTDSKEVKNKDDLEH